MTQPPTLGKSVLYYPRPASHPGDIYAAESTAPLLGPLAALITGLGDDGHGNNPNGEVFLQVFRVMAPGFTVGAVPYSKTPAAGCWSYAWDNKPRHIDPALVFGVETDPPAREPRGTAILVAADHDDASKTMSRHGIDAQDTVVVLADWPNPRRYIQRIGSVLVTDTACSSEDFPDLINELREAFQHSNPGSHFSTRILW